MLRAIAITGLLALSPSTFANNVEGKWRTESNDEGGYLEVTIAPCESDATKTCGIITNAFLNTVPDPEYVNLGKFIVMDMESSNGTSFSGGTIWDPVKDKTYNSKMSLDGDDLEVKGCIGFICSGEDWTRVK